MPCGTQGMGGGDRPISPRLLGNIYSVAHSTPLGPSLFLLFCVPLCGYPPIHQPLGPCPFTSTGWQSCRRRCLSYKLVQLSFHCNEMPNYLERRTPDDLSPIRPNGMMDGSQQQQQQQQRSWESDGSSLWLSSQDFGYLVVVGRRRSDSMGLGF